MCGRNIVLIGFLSLVGPSCTNSDNFELLRNTLKSINRTVCDEKEVSLSCPTDTEISILEAQYGDRPPKDDSCSRATTVRCKLPNIMQYMLLQRVLERCQAKPTCTFSTKIEPEDDPCPKSRKYVAVSYKCRPNDFRSLTACFDEIVELSCDPHWRIAILDAQFGRRATYEALSCPQPVGIADETCSAPHAVDTVMRICHGRRRCQFVASKRIFLSNCQPESRPYLKVTYACVPLGVLLPKYEATSENDDIERTVFGNNIDHTDASEKWKGTGSLFSPIAGPSLEQPTATIKPTTELIDLHTSTTHSTSDSERIFKSFIYIGAAILITVVIGLLIIGVRCYFQEKAKENAKNGNMFTTEAPNVFSDAISDLDNDVEISHISGTFYDPVHPDMILYRDADGTRNTIRAMKPLSTIYPSAGVRMYGNADYVPQPRELGRFPRSKSNEEEGDPTSPKSIGAYSASKFYYG